MKLKYTTKLFIVVNAIIIVFRTLQVMFLTESNIAFLKGGVGRGIVNVAGTVLVILSLLALFSNSSKAVRQPEKINCRGICSTVTAALVGVMYLITGIMAVVDMRFGSKLTLVLALLSLASCALMALSAFNIHHFAVVTALPFIAFWVAEFVIAYFYYTEHPLRVRTVYEIFAVCFVILFFVTFGKAVSGVNSEKSFRRIYPLGLTASALCIASVVPELIATVFGFSDKVTESAVHPLALSAAALFTGFFTINTFKKSNTIHPKRKRRMEMEQREHPYTDEKTEI